MPKIATTFLVQVVIGLSSFLGAGLTADKPQVTPLAHFRFNGDGKDQNKDNPEFELTNTQFKDNALYINGEYDLGNNPNGGYRAVCKTPKLDYTKFTVAIRFKPEEFDGQKTNLFTGGTSYRWFGMHRSVDGNLTITLNNQVFSYEIKANALETGKWTVVACGFDLSSRKIVVYFNGKKTADVDLPKDFKLEVIDSKVKDKDKVWSFTNYSNAQVFHGLVDELIIYEKMLTTEEFGAIPLRP